MQTSLDADTYTQLVLLELEHEFEQLIGYTAVHYLLNISFTAPPLLYPSLPAEGSAECKARPPCSKKDYFQIHTPCDLEGKVRRLTHPPNTTSIIARLLMHV